MISRRAAMIGGAVGVTILAARQTNLLDILRPKTKFAFTELDDPAGFRSLSGGAISLGGVPLFGLDDAKPQGLKIAEFQIDQNICNALFNTSTGTAIPLAYFYDYQCPICRTLSPNLRKLDGVEITWHDLAGLGPASETAALAAIAARKQGGFDAFHDRLMRATFQPNEGYIRSLSDGIGLDTPRLITDMKQPETMAQLWTSRALANRFGMIGTPGIVLGHTAVLGNIDNPSLRDLLTLEQNEPTRTCT